MPAAAKTVSKAEGATSSELTIRRDTTRKDRPVAV